MASFSGDAEGSTEDITGRKKSKLRSLKTRLFGRSKRGSSTKKNPKLSQSESNITSGKELGSEEDLSCPQGMMSSRALSHDSIFLDDQVLKEAEPDRVSSQENVQGRIKALQKKLQQQKMHLGPPPLVLPIRRPEDPEGRSDDDYLSSSPAEISVSESQGTLSDTSPISPNPKQSPTKYASQTVPVSVPSNSSVDESPSDFSSPAQLTPRLDTSAARHRMSVKPRNQRAGSKKKIGEADSDLALNNIDHPDSDSEKELQSDSQEEVTLETQQGETISPVTSQLQPSKPPEVVPLTSAVENKSMTDLTPLEAVPSVPSQVLRVKTHRTGDTMSSERPHSCFLPSEMKDKRDAGFEIEVMRHTLNKTGITDQLSSAAGLEEPFRSSSPQQQVQNVPEGTSVIKRSSQGSGSFHFSVTTAKNRDGERPRSGSFAGVLEKTEGRHRYEKKPISSMKEKEELRELQLRGASSAAGRLRQGGAQQKSSDFLLDKRESLKKLDSVVPPTSVTSDTDAVKSEEEKEEVERQEAREEEGKVAFGVKLRSTSLSMRFRSEAAASEEQCDKQKGEEVSNNTSNKSRKVTPESVISSVPLTSGDLRQTDPTLPGLSSPVKKTPPSPWTDVQSTAKVENSSFTLKEIESIPAAPQEPAPTPQSASSEVSWMSLAMEKTKSIQQLFTRFPREFSGAPPRPQAQAPPASQAPTPPVAPTQTQTVKMQQSVMPLEVAKQPPTDAVKAEMAQSRSQAQVVKPSLVAVQQKTLTASPVKSNTPREPITSKQISQPQPQLNSTPSASRPAVKTNPTAAQPPLLSATKTQTPSPMTQPPLLSATKTQGAAQAPLLSATKTQTAAQSPLLSATKTQTTSPTTQPPLLSATKTPTTSQLAQGSTTQSLAQSYLSSAQQQQQPPWTNRAPQSANPVKSVTPALASVSTTAPAPPVPPAPESASGEEKETPVQEKEPAPLSVSQRAAFLEKRAERVTPPATKGVELKKAPTEAQTLVETPVSPKTSTVVQDTKPEGRQWAKPAESSPTKIPDRPQDDKWPRKNVASSPARSLSPTVPSPLQSMPEGGQPSWMELAKRKSMAWSDKSMD
ncbi:proteoglycan 4 [Notolabrus celidotus]|uniref:proteoglycan 4 n=1 Tax=Notolabrus celidotus TaxID=1203425 RepID=UPI00149084E5|nr:proteoglycan 4 [Notolabrus celidotus]